MFDAEFWVMLASIASVLLFFDMRRRRAYRAALCRRGEHVYRQEEAEFYRVPSHSPGWPSYGVADVTTEQRQVCRHCGDERPWLVVNRRAIQGITLPGERMAELRQNGRLRRY